MRLASYRGITVAMHSARLYPAFITILALVTAVTACEPCGAIVDINGHIIDACPPNGSEDESSESGSSSEPTGGDNICEDAPAGPWGSCHDGACDEVDGVVSSCVGTNIGTICVPTCIGHQCDDLACTPVDCGGDDVAMTCILECADDDKCPSPLMACADNGMCVWTF